MQNDFQIQMMELFRRDGEEIARLNREDPKHNQNVYDTIIRESTDYNCELIENGGFSLR